MHDVSVGAPRALPWRDTLAVALASLGLYLLLAQDALHGLDVHVHVFFLTQGHLEHPLHLLYLRIVGLIWPALAALGLKPIEALRLMSALGTVVGVLCIHRAAAELQLSRGHAALVATMSAVVPATVFFATVAEIHGVFAAFAGAGWWVWARFVRAMDRAAVSGSTASVDTQIAPLRSQITWSLWLGIATGVAASVHATGHALVVLFGACALAVGGWRSASRWRGLVIAALAHVGVTTVLAWIQPGRGRAPFADQVAFLFEFDSDGHSLSSVWRVVRDEWLIAFMPLAVTSLVAICRRQTRALGVAVLACVCVYLGFAFALLDDINERGAYLLPLAFPLAWLTLQACGARIAALAGLIALVTAFAEVRAHDHTTPAAWLPGLVALSHESPVALICRDVGEQEPITRSLPDIPVLRVDSLLASADVGEAGYPAFCAAFDAQAAFLHGLGRVVLITRSAHEALLATGNPFFIRFLREHLPQNYAIEEIDRAGFAAIRVGPRQVKLR